MSFDLFAVFRADAEQAHFDCLLPPFNLVDGARSKWCIPQLLDVLIYFHENESFKPFVRREFNQQKVFADCLLKELQYQCAGLEKIKLEGIDQNIALKIRFDAIHYPWNHIESVRTIVVKCPPSKSKKKYVEVVNQLCGKLGAIMATANLGNVIKEVATKLLCGLDPRSVCSPRPTDADPAVVAILPVDRLLDLANIDFGPLYAASPDLGKFAEDAQESCLLMSHMGAKRRSSSIRSVTSVSSADGDYIVGTFALGGRSPVPINLMSASMSMDDISHMCECDSLPDQDLSHGHDHQPMDCDDEDDGGRKSEFDTYVDSLESSEHTVGAVMFAANPVFIDSPKAMRGKIFGEADLYERSFSFTRRSSSRRSSANTIMSNTTADSTYSGSPSCEPLSSMSISSIFSSGSRDTPPFSSPKTMPSPKQPHSKKMVSTVSGLSKMWPSIH